MGTVIQFQAMVRCAHCGGEAKLLMVPGEMTPWWRKFPSFVRGMVMPIGLITLGLLALYCALLSMIPYAGPALASALLAVYCVWVVRDAARGRAHLPLVNSVTEFLDLLADLFFVAIRFTMATALLWTPLVVRLAMLEEPERVLLEPSLLWLDPLFCAVVALAALYVPAALVICTIGRFLGELVLGYSRPEPDWLHYAIFAVSTAQGACVLAFLVNLLPRINAPDV